MKSKIKYISNILIVLLMHMNIDAQNALTAEFDCERGCIDLSINEGHPLYDVEWQILDKFGNYTTIFGWPKNGLNGNDGNEDLCKKVLEGREYKVIVHDALCGVAELNITIPPCENECDNFTVTIESYNNVSECGGFDDIYPPPPTYDLCDGSITVSGPSGTNFQWSNGANGSSISNLCTGTYTVTATNGNCTSIETFEICCCTYSTPGNGSYPTCSPESVASIDADVSSPTGANTNNGSIDLLLPNSGNIKYNWTGPNGFKSNSQDLTGLGVGTYCVKVFSGCGDPVEKCFTLIDCSTTTIVVSGTVTNTCSGYSYGSISSSVSGGLLPYKYKWSNGKATSSINNLATGQYCVTVTDKNGCKATNCFTVGLNSLTSQATTNPCGTQYFCNGIPTNFVPYNGNLTCLYNDPFDCTRVNCYCPLTGGYVSGFNNPYLNYSYDWNQCILYGLCPDGSGWDIAQYGYIKSWYQYVQVCANCWACYYIEACYINGYYQIITAYQVGDSNCGGKGPGLAIDEPLSLSSHIRLNELDFLMKRDSLVDKNSVLLIPEGLSDTLFIEDYTRLFAEMREGKERVNVYELPQARELQEIDCKMKDCRSNDASARSTSNKKSDENIEFTISPNPFSNNIEINSKENSSIFSNYHVELVSLIGQIITKKNITGNRTSINTEQLPSGFYIINIYSEGKIIESTKLIKQ